ncbi:MAG: hypothetical protein HFI34_10725 [Lachnospiraceae bacterium]|nr:hypothetical protein [Lachnospiraceae bacterium]
MNIKLNEHIIDAISCNCIGNQLTIYQNTVPYAEILKHIHPVNDIRILKYDGSVIENYKNMALDNTKQPDENQTEMNLTFVLAESMDDKDI